MIPDGLFEIIKVKNIGFRDQSEEFLVIYNRKM